MELRTIAGLVVAGCVLAGVGFLVGRSSAPVEQAAPAAVTPAPAAPAAHPAPAAEHPERSLVYHPFLTVGQASEAAVANAMLVVRGIRQGDTAALELASVRYLELEASENFGGEYPTLRWVSDYLAASSDVQRAMRKQPDGRRFLELFGRDDWSLFIEYVEAKYGLSPMDTERLWYLDELVRFNSPYRAQWERSDRVLELLALEPGMEVADVGAGGGFYSFRFVDLLGPDGMVYALEMSDLHMGYLDKVKREEGLDTLSVVATDGSFPDFPEAMLDRVFLCATYQTLYLSVRDAERAAWLEGVHRALKPGGLLVVVDNEPALDPGLPRFGGIAVARSLVEAQLTASGFELVSSELLVPQRYAIVLRKPAASSR